MAKRRCFSIDVIESTAYRNLSNDAKILYFGLMAHSDDEGVVINPAIPMLLQNVDESALNELTKGKFLINVDGVYIIKHWYLHNKIQPSKVVESIYTDELSRLTVNSRNEYVFL